jgi:hypothetical protein
LHHEQDQRLIILVAVALLVYFITRQVYEPEARSETISSTILLERVRPVLKLITVEGEFNEIYDSRSSASMFEILKSFTPILSQPHPVRTLEDPLRAHR